MSDDLVPPGAPGIKLAPQGIPESAEILPSGPSHASLKRVVGVGGATMMGLGSIVGTGIFVSLGLAAGSAGPAVLLAIAVASLVAVCNGLSSAQLAAAHPVSGGTYEYGHRWLHPLLGFVAGWMFLCAKAASAATAALGIAGHVAQVPSIGPEATVGIALALVAGVTGIVATGLRISSAANTVFVSVTLAALALFIGAGLFSGGGPEPERLRPFFAPVSSDATPLGGFLQACALMFVAFTGYGRVATLGEEIVEPARNIPRAVVSTLAVSAALYLGVAFVALGTASAAELELAARRTGTPLELVADRLHVPGLAPLVQVGAVTAMLGVMLNLLLGLSRVVLAMGRRRDLPGLFSILDGRSASPVAAILLVGGLIGGLVLVGDVKTTWSFSTFTVLVYYSLTNLCVLRMPRAERRYSGALAAFGLAACLFLAFWIDRRVWLVGLGFIAAGAAWWWVAEQVRRRRGGEAPLRSS